MSSCENCTEHGTCIDHTCSCDLGFFLAKNNACSIKGSEEWGQSWMFFRVFFIIMFSVTFLYSWLKLYKSLKKEKTYDCTNKLKRLFLSPKNLSLLGICIISLIKILWLSYDPLLFKNESNRMLDRLLFETIYPLIFTVLASVLLVWASMYQVISQTASGIFGLIKKLIIFLMIIVYPFTWILCINKGLRLESFFWYWIGYVGLATGAAILSVFFVIFSFLMFRYLNKGKKIDKKSIEIDLECSAVSVKKSMIAGNFRQSCDGENMGSEIQLKGDLKKNKNNEKFYIELTKNDKKLIIKILVTTTFSGISGLLIIAVGTPFTISGALSNPSMTLFGLFLAFIFDLCICALIIITFTRQIKNQKKKDIKNMFYIARKNRRKSPNIQISDDFQNISKRLEMYYI